MKPAVKPARQEDGVGWSRLGAAFLIAYVLVVVTGLAPAALRRLQARDAYLVVTGLALASLVAYQFKLSLARMDRRPVGPSAVARHRVVGALLPLGLLLHAPGFGFGYLRMLSLVFGAALVLGLVARGVRSLHRRVPWAYDAWFISHIAVSVLLVGLIGFHVVIALAYE
ncbi:MAG: hypothetical protein R3B06_04890 [Kofleriaceae bacterium]